MNINPETIAEAAQNDVDAGISLPVAARSFVLSVLGPRPAEPDPSDPRVIRAEEQREQRHLLPELEADMLAQTQAIPVHSALIKPVLVGIGIIEIAGNYDLLSVVDLPAFTRIILSLAAAAFVVTASAAAADALTTLKGKQGDSGQRRWGQAVLFGYTFVVAAIAILRISQSGGVEDASVLERLASATLLLGTTAGPAFLAKTAAAEWQNIHENKTSHADTLRRHAEISASVGAAENFLDSLYVAPGTWDADATQLLASYERQFHIAVSRKRS